jgi:hypothetical protein
MAEMLPKDTLSSQTPVLLATARFLLVVRFAAALLPLPAGLVAVVAASCSSSLDGKPGYSLSLGATAAAAAAAGCALRCSLIGGALAGAVAVLPPDCAVLGAWPVLLAAPFCLPEGLEPKGVADLSLPVDPLLGCVEAAVIRPSAVFCLPFSFEDSDAAGAA